MYHHVRTFMHTHDEFIDFTNSKGLHNFTHPRTDAVVIMIAIDETGDKILLGRGVCFFPTSNHHQTTVNQLLLETISW